MPLDPSMLSTIDSWLTANDRSSLLSFIDQLSEAKNRAEAKVDAYLHEIRRLAQSYAAITEPASGKLVTERAERHPPPAEAPRGRRPSSDISVPPSSHEASSTISADDL